MSFYLGVTGILAPFWALFAWWFVRLADSSSLTANTLLVLVGGIAAVVFLVIVVICAVIIMLGTIKHSIQSLDVESGWHGHPPTSAVP